MRNRDQVKKKKEKAKNNNGRMFLLLGFGFESMILMENLVLFYLENNSSLFEVGF